MGKYEFLAMRNGCKSSLMLLKCSERPLGAREASEMFRTAAGCQGSFLKCSERPLGAREAF